MTNLFKKEELLLHFDYEPETIMELLNVFENAYPECIEEIDGAIINKDYTKIEHASHLLKGMISNFFSEPLVEKASKIELICRYKKEEDFSQDLLLLKQGIPDLIIELKTEFS